MKINRRFLSITLIGMLLVPAFWVASAKAQSPQKDCATFKKEALDLVDSIAATSEAVGRIKERIGENEPKEKTPDAKVAAFKADQEILHANQATVKKSRADLDSLMDSRRRECQPSRDRIYRLLDQLQKISEAVGGDEEFDDSGQGHGGEKKDRDKADARKIKTQIEGLITKCCLDVFEQRILENLEKTSTAPLLFERTKPVELSIGYQYQRAPDELAKNLNGIDGQLFYDFSKHIGIGGDFAWTTGSDQIGTTTDVTLHRFTGLFGPRFNINHSLHNGSGSGKGLIFHFPILIGFDHDSTRFQSSTISTSFTSTAFAMSFGANMDVMLTKNFGIRPIDFAYQPTHFGGEWQSNWKLGAGIVFRFGKEK